MLLLAQEGIASAPDERPGWAASKTISPAREHGIALVFDEIVSAFRTGRFLAAHHEPDALPDVVVMAKGLGAGYVPLGAVLAPARIADELAERTGLHVAAGSAILDEIEDRGLIERGAEVGARLRTGLEDIAARSPLVGDVRGRGLLLGMELVHDKATLEPFGSDLDPADAIRHQRRGKRRAARRPRPSDRRRGGGPARNLSSDRRRLHRDRRDPPR